MWRASGEGAPRPSVRGFTLLEVLVTSALFAEGLVDRLMLFIAPKAFGDEQAPSWSRGRTVMDPSQAIRFEWEDVRRLGEDILLRARISEW